MKAEDTAALSGSVAALTGIAASNLFTPHILRPDNCYSFGLFSNAASRAKCLQQLQNSDLGYVECFTVKVKPFGFISLGKGTGLGSCPLSKA